MSVKEIMNSSKHSINRSKLNVSETFQNLDYLKQVPKKIDCWLSNNKQGSEQLSTPKNQTSKLENKLLRSKEKSEKRPSRVYQS